MTFIVFMVCGLTNIACTLASAFSRTRRVRLLAVAVVAATGAAITEVVERSWVSLSIWSVIAVVQAVNLLLTVRAQRRAGMSR